MRKHKPPSRAALTILFIAVIFIVLSITMLIVGGAVFVMIRTGLLGEVSTLNTMLPLAIMVLASILIGTFVAAVISHIPLKPLNIMISGMNRLASGDYKTRIELGHHHVAHELSHSFNTLADELQNTEMLRSDFVNNFSHEFKTPIVSIRGFAKLLKKKNLTDEQRSDYLDIIIEESGRLAEMSTNVLNLTKVENQSILTDVSCFNLSEQLRNCILLLEKKWTLKNVKVTANFDEYSINANEELLKQVWINLIDNAVKFTQEAGEIILSITEMPDSLIVSITNGGAEISERDQKRIFDKFWQGDASHASDGTGIGLSIVKRITELHKGSISVTSAPAETTFSVELPNRRRDNEGVAYQ